MKAQKRRIQFGVWLPKAPNVGTIFPDSTDSSRFDMRSAHELAKYFGENGVWARLVKLTPVEGSLDQSTIKIMGEYGPSPYGKKDAMARERAIAAVHEKYPELARNLTTPEHLIQKELERDE